MAGPMTPRQALLAALEGLEAYDQGDFPSLMATGAQAPCMTFAGAVALAASLRDEIARLGGDPRAVTDRVFCNGMEPAAA